MQDKLDKDLQSLFREQSRNLSEEPFLSDTLRLVKKRRIWHILEQNLILLFAVVACALFSRFFIKGSMLLSGYLDWVFTTPEFLLDRPAGIIFIALCGAVLLLFSWRRMISLFL